MTDSEEFRRAAASQNFGDVADRKLGQDIAAGDAQFGSQRLPSLRIGQTEVSDGPLHSVIVSGREACGYQTGGWPS